jgi:hypothetical protein
LDCSTELNQQGIQMNKFDEHYQPPISSSQPEVTRRLTSEEWLYAVNIFCTMAIGAAILCGIWPIWKLQKGGARFAFSAEFAPHEPSDAFVGAIPPLGATCALFGVFMALFFVVRRRTRAGVPPPNYGLFWPMLLIVPLGAYLFGLVMLGAGTTFVWLQNGSISVVWTMLTWRERLIANAHVGFSIGTVTALFYAFLGTMLARGAVWTHKRPILVGVAAWVISLWSMELVAYPLQFILARVGLAPNFN